MERDALDLGTEHVGRLFRKFFVPTLLGMLSISAVTVADGIFVQPWGGQRRHSLAYHTYCYAPVMNSFTGIRAHGGHRLLGGDSSLDLGPRAR